MGEEAAVHNRPSEKGIKTQCERLRLGAPGSRHLHRAARVPESCGPEPPGGRACAWRGVSGRARVDHSGPARKARRTATSTLFGQLEVISDPTPGLLGFFFPFTNVPSCSRGLPALPGARCGRESCG